MSVYYRILRAARKRFRKPVSSTQQITAPVPPITMSEVLERDEQPRPAPQSTREERARRETADWRPKK
jgi:hypothetical protein